MNNLEQEQKNELIKNVEFVLKPVNGEFISFEDPIEMYASIRPLGDHNNIISEENKIIIYRMKISTDHGEFVMSFGSNELKDSKWAVNVACAYSFFDKNIIPEKNWREINERILDLYRQKI